MKVRPAYKCLLCGKILQVEKVQDLPQNTPFDTADRMETKWWPVDSSVTLKGDVYVVHDCEDGGVGLAHFAGFKRAEL